MMSGEKEAIVLQVSGNRSQNMQAIPETPFPTATALKQWKRWLLETRLVIALKESQPVHEQRHSRLW